MADLHARSDGARTNSPRPWSGAVVATLGWLVVSETRVLVLTGLLVGLGAGLGAVVFRALIDLFTQFFFGTVHLALTPLLGPAAVVLLPALGGLIFGPLIYFFAREAKGHGVPEVMLAVAQRGGRIRPAVVVVKALASAICIGSGGSVGREGPIVQIGSALGSTLGQVFNLSDDRMKTLVACGAAGGIAATFNAPIAGVFFALEVILGEFTTRAFGVVVISSVTASVVGRSFFGDVASFPVPAYALSNGMEFALYVVLGLLAGIVGVGFTRTLYWFEDRFDTLPMPEYLKPLPGGLLLGCLGVFLPQVFGVGYPAMEQALTGQYGLGLLVALVPAKILAVSLTIGSGGSGGVFAPSLFIGSMLGTAFGAVAQTVLPGVVTSPGAYGLVGMGAVFAGAARAPITSVIILFELTGDYRIILPLMVTVVIATLLSEALSVDTIYTLKLRRRGIDLRAGRDVDVMRTIPVAQAMSAGALVAPELTVAEAADQLEQRRQRALVVVDEVDVPIGIVTVKDLERSLLDNRPGSTLGDIASRPVETVFPEQTLSDAVRAMGARDLGQVPVVTRTPPNRVVGVLRRDDVVRAYSQAVLHRLEDQQARPVLPRELRGGQLVEVPVEPHSPLAEHTVASLALPQGSLIVSIERSDETVIPRGDTSLHAGDRLIMFVHQEKVGELHEHLAAVGAPVVDRARSDD